MKFSLENIISSVALFLKATFIKEDGTAYAVYDSPTLDSNYPCFYVFIFNPETDDEYRDRRKRNIGVKIVFVQQRNSDAGNVQLLNIAEQLDHDLDTLPYKDGAKGCLLHIFDKKWKIEDQELHYEFHLRQRVSYERTHNPMTTEETHVKVRKGS